MLDLSLVGWVVVALSAVMVEITKTGIPGLGILVVPLMADVLPARSSLGVLLGINYWRTRTKGKDAPVPSQWWFAVGLGFMAGVTIMMANAAGPIMIIYLLAMRLPKIEFVGTGAWFLFVVNWLKVPFSANLDLMTAASVKLDLMMLLFIAAGAVIGIFFLKRIPQKAFTAVVQVLAAAAAVKLLF